MILHIIINTIEDTDFDGNSISYKKVNSTFDGKCSCITTTETTTVSDDDCKINHRAKLTAIGFTWKSDL